MSISRFQERFLSGGCAKLLLGGMAAVFVGGLLYMGAGGGGSDPNAGTEPVVAATVGNVEVPATAFETAIESRLQQVSQQMPGSVPPMQLASVQAGAVTSVVDGSTAMYLARQSGADFSDESIMKVISEMLDQQMMMQQMQFDMMSQQQPGQKKETFEEFVKKQTGKTVKELKDEQVKEIQEALKDPAKRELLMADAARGLLVQKFKEKAAPTDQELLDYYNTYEVKRILVKDEKDRKAADIASSLLADIKAKKLTFEQAIDRYSKDMPQPKKRLSEVTLPLQGSMIQSQEEYKSLRGLKVGEVSEVITTPEGQAIYKVVKVTPNLPKDFEKEKSKYRDQVAEQRAQALVQQEMEKAAKGNLVTWKTPGYQVLYEYGKTFSSPEMADETKRLETMRGVYEKAKKAAAEPGPGSEQAALVAYVAFDAIYNDPKSNKKELAEERVEVLNNYLETNESPAVRLELVDLYAEQKDAEAAAQNLIQVAQSNNDYEIEGQGLYSQISAKATKLKSAGILDAESAKQVETELARWRTEKAQYEKDKAADEAEKKKQEAEMQKELDKQMQEEAAKKKADAAKVAPPKK